MAKTDTVNTNKGKSLDPTIEELCQKHHLPKWVMAGVKKHYGWGAGKRMGVQEFTEKVEKWKSSPMYVRGDK